MVSLTEILIPISFFLIVFGIIYIYVRARNRERLALIDKGVDASIFLGPQGKKENKHWLLKLGLFFIGIAVGVVAGYLISLAGMNDKAAYVSMIFLFGGLGMVVYYPLAKRME